jgi:carbon storage regulator
MRQTTRGMFVAMLPSLLRNPGICISRIFRLGSSLTLVTVTYPLGAKPPGKESSVLVLTRKLNEKIVIADRIVVTVVKLDGGQVRLGIEAPREIAVFREEIHPRLHPLV